MITFIDLDDRQLAAFLESAADLEVVAICPLTTTLGHTTAWRVFYRS